MAHEHLAIGTAARKAQQLRKAQGGGPRRKGGMLKFGSIPLLLIPVIIYNIMAFIYMDDVSKQQADAEAAQQTEVTASEDGVDHAEATLIGNAADEFTKTRFTIPLATGGQWQISSGDILLTLALCLLFLELIRATSADTSAIINHAFSLILFVGCLVEFILLPAFATSVFFLLMLMVLLDVLAGFIVTIVTARRDIAVGTGFE